MKLLIYLKHILAFSEKPGNHKFSKRSSKHELKCLCIDASNLTRWFTGDLKRNLDHCDTHMIMKHFLPSFAIPDVPVPSWSLCIFAGGCIQEVEREVGINSAGHKKIANVVVGLMEVYPPICLDGYHGGLPFNLLGMSIWYMFWKTWTKSPHLVTLIFQTLDFLSQKTMEDSPSQPTFRRWTPPSCSQEPSWKPVVPKLESLAKKAQKRWRDLVQLNERCLVVTSMVLCYFLYTSEVCNRILEDVWSSDIVIFTMSIKSLN